MIPKRVVLLVCGLPGVGKSTFCRHLVAEHGFGHIDLGQSSWAGDHPVLAAKWETSRALFVRALRARFDRVVIEGKRSNFHTLPWTSLRC